MKCSITGHRNVANEYEARLEIQKKIMLAYQAGCREFLCGMAEGIDSWACEFLTIAREYYGYSDIRIIAVLPFPSFARSRSHLLRKCDKTITICPKYEKWCYTKRDKYLAENCDMFASFYDGRAGGGTKKTLDMLRRRGVPEAGTPQEEKVEEKDVVQMIFDEIEEKGMEEVIRGCMGNASEEEINVAIADAFELRKMEEARKKDLKFGKEKLAKNEWAGAELRARR